jgi:dienelactone hydrolase
VSTTSSGGLADPALDGPEPVSHLVDTVSVTATGTNVGVDAYYPASGSGPFPVVLLNHGFQLPTSQYRTYAQRLASHGMVAVLVDYQAGMFSVNHVKNTREILGVLDWALGRAELHADPNAVGVTGHSLGGKLSFQAAVMDSRIKAVLGLDPVDGAQNCSAENCPDVTDMLPGLQAATGVLGETTDSSGGMQPCAPAANNYATFYDQLPSPTFKVTVNGANHMSFLDDLASCGLTCMFCQQATATNSEVNGLARAYVTAFFRRHLRGEPGYDAYLTGDQARARYVDGGLAAIETK